jgi:metallophosphoesterase superfamily enzyme
MRFLYDAPAILHKDALIIGDTHFGMEIKLRRRGIYADNFSEQMFERIKKLLQKTKAKKLILLGDVKEEITVLDRRAAEMISKLSMLAQVIIVKGNHDGGIEPTCGRQWTSCRSNLYHPSCLLATRRFQTAKQSGIDQAEADVIGAEGFVYEGVALVHGHSWPEKELMKCKTIICTHQHPSISFIDRMGKRHSEPAWIIAPADGKNISRQYDKYTSKIKLILMPAFNPLVGSALNLYSNRHLGPLLNKKLFKVDDALVFQLNGNSLGKLKNIKM